MSKKTEQKDVVSCFKDLVFQYPEVSATVSTIKALAMVIEQSHGTFLLSLKQTQ